MIQYTFWNKITVHFYRNMSFNFPLYVTFLSFNIDPDMEYHKTYFI